MAQKVPGPDWFQKLMLPGLKKLEAKNSRIRSNLSRHITPQVLSLCRENDIYSRFLSHPSKQKWRNVLSEYKDNAEKLTIMCFRSNIFGLLKRLYESII